MVVSIIDGDPIVKGGSRNSIATWQSTQIRDSRLEASKKYELHELFLDSGL